MYERGTFLAAVADDCVPIAIRLGVVNGCDLKRERFVVLERRPPLSPRHGTPITVNSTVNPSALIWWLFSVEKGTKPVNQGGPFLGGWHYEQVKAWEQVMTRSTLHVGRGKG